MKYLFYTWKLGCLLLLVFAGCSSKKSVSSYHSFESECLGVELDGSETLRAWGRGKNRTDAIEQAKKNAVRDVLFKGVAAGSRECSVRPLVTEVNAQERYAYYFNDFFRDGGEYLKYQKQVFEGYGTDQMALLNNAVVGKKGNYVYYMCGADAQNWRTAFLSMI